MATGGGVRVGAFQVCYSGGGGCHSIDTHCNAGGGQVFDGSDCDNLQAVRAFLIMGLLLSLVITALTFFMFFAHRMADRTLYWTAHILMAVESLFILIAFSAAASLLNDFDADKGGAFGCLVTAWVLGLVAWALWWAAARYEEEGVANRIGAGATTGASAQSKEAAGVPSGNLQSVTVAPGAAQPPAPYGGHPEQPVYQPQYQQPQSQPLPQPQYSTQPQAVSPRATASVPVGATTLPQHTGETTTAY